MIQRTGRQIIPGALLATADERHEQQYDEEENMRIQHAIAICAAVLLLAGGAAIAQEVLPFPEPPSASVAGKTLKDSNHQWRTAESHLPKDAPNIVIFMTDDAGFANPSTFGGPIHTPTLDRLAASGISYNAFHTTAMCSPTRAALLTGRNHHRVGAGQIAELIVGKVVTAKSGEKEFRFFYDPSNVLDGELTNGGWKGTGTYAITDNNQVCVSMAADKGRYRCLTAVRVGETVQKFNVEGKMTFVLLGFEPASGL